MIIEEHWRNIALIEKRPHNTADVVNHLFPGQRVCVCDFHVEGCEQGRLDPTGVLRYGNLLIVDHHTPLLVMRQRISSAVIANAYVRTYGRLGDNFAVVINHTDADSVLSALIMTGALPSDDTYAEAAVAADHTGAENVIADVLQALESDRNLDKSIDMLFKLVERRSAVRQELRAFIDAGRVQWFGNVACLVLDKTIDAGLVPALLPDAQVIVIASPMDGGSSRWRIRVRLGLHTEGIALNQLNLPDFGGRWNAGSTNRYGGTTIAPAQYARLIHTALKPPKP